MQTNFLQDTQTSANTWQYPHRHSCSAFLPPPPTPPMWLSIPLSSTRSWEQPHRPHCTASQGKIRIDTKPVKVYADATLIMPILVGRTFAKRFHAGLPVGALKDGVVFDKAYTAAEHDVERKKLVQSDAGPSPLLC